MKWLKKGLVYVPDGHNPIMSSHAAIPFADPINDGLVRIYFSSRNDQGKSLPFYLDVHNDNISNILAISQKPLLQLGDLGTFDEAGIMPSCIVNYQGLKFMYYIAWNPQVTVSYRLSIGLAISSDNGNSYKKFSIGPICDRNVNEPYFNTAPFVLIENNTWRMWYISCTGWVIINGYPEPKYHVKYCESNDGIHWDKNGIISIDYDTVAQAIGRPSVFFHNGKYKMFYSYRSIENYRTDRKYSYRLGYAESFDGIEWVKYNNETGIDVSNNEIDWDYEMIEYCHVFTLRDSLYMLYNGNGFGKTGFGYAIAE